MARGGAVQGGLVTRIAIVGGGPAGYEAALVASQLGAHVTLVEREGLGGACVLADCVPSKTLIATSASMTTIAGASALGVGVADVAGVAGGPGDSPVTSQRVRCVVDLPRVNARVKA